MKLTKGKRKQPVNAAMNNDRLSLTRFAKKLGVTRFMFGVLKLVGLKCYK